MAGGAGGGRVSKGVRLGGKVVGGSTLLDTVMVLLGGSFKSLLGELGVAWLRGGGEDGGGEVKGYVGKVLTECLECSKGEKGWLWEKKACERLMD